MCVNAFKYWIGVAGFHPRLVFCHIAVLRRCVGLISSTRWQSRHRLHTHVLKATSWEQSGFIMSQRSITFQVMWCWGVLLWLWECHRQTVHKTDRESTRQRFWKSPYLKSPLFTWTFLIETPLFKIKQKLTLTPVSWYSWWLFQQTTSPKTAFRSVEGSRVHWSALTWRV